MKNFIKNILLLGSVMVLSYFTAPYLGNLYSSIFGEGSSWIGSKSSWDFIIGFPLGYIIFLILIFCSIRPENHKMWVGWLLVPPIIFFGYDDIKHIYLPILLALGAWGIAVIIRKIFFRKAVVTTAP